jgi:hypothetical protein
MKNVTLKTLVVLAGVFSAAGVFAQSKVVQADVPFAFSVENKVLPAGHYEISEIDTQMVPMGVLVRNVDHPSYGITALIAMDPSRDLKARSDSRLVFNNYGGQYFLREVLGPAGTLNAELFVTKSEKNAKHQSEIAGQPVRTTVVAGL